MNNRNALLTDADLDISVELEHEISKVSHEPSNLATVLANGQRNILRDNEQTLVKLEAERNIALASIDEAYTARIAECDRAITSILEALQAQQSEREHLQKDRDSRVERTTREYETSRGTVEKVINALRTSIDMLEARNVERNPR